MVLLKLKVELWSWGVKLHMYKFNLNFKEFENLCKSCDWTLNVDVLNYVIIWNQTWGKEITNGMDDMSFVLKWWRGGLRVVLDYAELYWMVLK